MSKAQNLTIPMAVLLAGITCQRSVDKAPLIKYTNLSETITLADEKINKANKDNHPMSQCHKSMHSDMLSNGEKFRPIDYNQLTVIKEAKKDSFLCLKAEDGFGDLKSISKPEDKTLNLEKKHFNIHRYKDSSGKEQHIIVLETPLIQGNRKVVLAILEKNIL